MRYRDRQGPPEAGALLADDTGSRGNFVPNDEVDEVRWISLAEAATLLSYDADRSWSAVDLGTRRRSGGLTIYLVRHAKAGDRSSWAGDDFLRPLVAAGSAASRRRCSTQFAGLPIDRLLSSPYVRCMETLVPLGGERMLAIEPVRALTEGASLEDALTLVRKHAHHDAVMCSHGDVIPMLLDHYAAQGVDLGPTPVCPKGCTWMLEVDATGDVASATYVTPPPE